MTSRPSILYSLSPRDQKILALTKQSYSGGSFSESIRVMRDVVEQLIPAGRLYLLESASAAPIIGSAISGVGITEGPEGILIVRVLSPERHLIIGELS
jgi:hypothetical protein